VIVLAAMRLRPAQPSSPGVPRPDPARVEVS
jgi:hypothetical protein